MTFGTGMAATVQLRLWISPADGLIRQSEWQIDDGEARYGRRPRVGEPRLMNYQWKHDQIKIDPDFGRETFRLLEEAKQ